MTAAPPGGPGAGPASRTSDVRRRPHRLERSERS